MLAPGTLLQSRYRIEQKINAGGTSTIYEATDERLHCQVAIKESSEPLQNIDEEVHRMFLNEAAALRTFIHPALPRVTNYFEESDRLYLVMDYIPGDDLKRLLEVRGEAFDVDEVLSWADQLLDALERLHSNNPPILHRDIKPHNLKLRQGRIILLDFGIAKGALTHLSLTSGRSIRAASPMYAPLEQINEEPTDPRSDLYSLAVTLYYLMTNVLPPTAVARAAALGRKQPDPLLPANQLNPKVPLLVAQVLHQAMSVFADDRRPVSAKEMRQALDAAKQAGALSTQPTPATLQQHKHQVVAQYTRPIGPIAVSPDGKEIAAASDDQVRVWEIGTGQVVLSQQVSQPGDTVYTVVFSQDGKYVAASTYNDKHIGVWDVHTKDRYLFKKLNPDSNYRDLDGTKMKNAEPVRLAFSPTDSSIVLAVYNGCLYSWNFKTGQASTKGMSTDTFTAAISPSGQHIAICDRGNIDVHTIQTGQKQTIYKCKVGDTPERFAFSPDGNYVAAGGRRSEPGKTDMKGWAGLWEIKTGKQILLIECSSNFFRFAVAPDNKSIAEGSSDNKIRVWDAASGRERIIGEYDSPISAITYSPDGKHIVTGSFDSTIRFWEVI